ncbi:hypothetical protein [Thiohalocapsa sp. ML1]|uniref:hypothetical protein n=1 Tax=Thiohalocapsa sp. ML1 TaxID=1431688 RepID=UPI0007324003|nr:hypothetical protein [Thiohalocapsa sp. ML1]
MVRTRFNHGWSRRGFALLWDAEVLGRLCPPRAIVSLRELFALVGRWPEDLPAAGGDALVVSGLEGALDVLSGADAARWIETDLRQAVFSFQDFYEGQAGLILWAPSGRNRIDMNAATESYAWKHRDAGADGLPLGRLLFAGAENEVERILTGDDPNVDYDGKHWAGLHHPRIS